MFHEPALRKTLWADNTLSQMKERKFQHTLQRLLKMPNTSLFSLPDDVSADTYWDISYDAQEHPEEKRLHSAGELRKLVLDRLPQECQLLSTEEYRLLSSMFRHNLQSMPITPDEYPACESLVRRLWGYVESREPLIFLSLPDEIFQALAKCLKKKKTQYLALCLATLNDTIAGYLYLTATVTLDEAMQLFRSHVTLNDGTIFDYNLMLRYFKADYDYVYDSNDELVLVHPGLGHPQDFFTSKPPFRPDPDSETVCWACADILPQEQDACRPMMRLLQKEMDASEAETLLTDLRLLIKQNVSIIEIHNTLREHLRMFPSDAMMDSLNELMFCTPRWATQTATRLQ